MLENEDLRNDGAVQAFLRADGDFEQHYLNNSELYTWAVSSLSSFKMSTFSTDMINAMYSAKTDQASEPHQFKLNF